MDVFKYEDDCKIITIHKRDLREDIESCENHISHLKYEIFRRVPENSILKTKHFNIDCKIKRTKIELRQKIIDVNLRKALMDAMSKYYLKFNLPCYSSSITLKQITNTILGDGKPLFEEKINLI